MKPAIAIIASLVLLANTCAAVMSASTNPVLQYNTSIKFTPNNYQGLYSSGDGTSPFIMLGTDSIHAIAPASGNVIARRTFAGGLKTDTNVVPVVGADGSGDSVFVVALPDGTLPERRQKLLRRRYELLGCQVLRRDWWSCIDVPLLRDQRSRTWQSQVQLAQHRCCHWR